VQKSLFNFSVQGLVNKGMAENEARAETEKYFALPSEDPAQPPPHLTGGAVDLTVVQFDEDKRQTFVELSRIIQDPSRHWMDRKISALSRQNLFLLHSRLLDMGTPFDAITPEAATAYFERQPKTATDIICRSNRRILWNAMTEAGFSFYELEWWHADFGNQCDMASTGRPAIYGPAPYSIANILHEEMRRTQHASCNYFITWGTTLHHPVAAGMP
jgi:D-alanyl-D-alanine dipeptidase